MIECTKFKEVNSGALQGFADIHLDNKETKFPGTHYGCKLFMKNGHRWVSMPSKNEYKNKEGETKYADAYWIDDKAIGDVFSKLAIQAIDKWCAENAQSESAPPVQEMMRAQPAQEMKNDTEEFPF